MMISLIDPIITEEDNLCLSSIHSEEEIHQALLCSLGSTCPWSQKTYWNTFGVFFYFILFYKSHIFNEQYHTFVALVPRQIGSYSVHHFWHIRFCNIIYKIINGLIGWSSHSTNSLLAPNQSAFVPGRTIHDNSILTHELLHTLKNKRGKVVSWRLRLT